MYLYAVWQHHETDPVDPDIYIFQPHLLSQNYSLDQAGWSSAPTIPKMDKLFCGNNLVTVPQIKLPKPPH